MASPSDETPSITTPQPYKVVFDQADIDQFHRKVQDARLPSAPLYPGLPLDKRDGGANAEFNPKAFPTLERMKNMLDKWKKKDFKAMEDELNE